MSKYLNNVSFVAIFSHRLLEIKLLMKLIMLAVSPLHIVLSAMSYSVIALTSLSTRTPFEMIGCLTKLCFVLTPDIK